MRAAVFTALADLADEDERVVLLTGDLGFMFIERFADRHPDRYFNVGVAEQNMVGIATGLAESGYLPYAYSIAAFAVLRPFEFIRNGPVAQQLPVRIIGVGGGFEYGSAGRTHHGLEDLAVLRTQPGLTVLAPVDYRQAAAAIRDCSALPGPVYFRIGKDDHRVVPGFDGRFRLGEVERIGSGRDVALISMGAIASEAVRAIDELALAGVRATCYIMPTLSPGPKEDFVRELASYPMVATVEAHYVVGGLGSLVAELLAERGAPTKLVRIGVSGIPDGRSGSEQYLNDAHGLAPQSICRRITAELSVVDG
jgi:transketolase